MRRDPRPRDSNAQQLPRTGYTCRLPQPAVGAESCLACPAARPGLRAAQPGPPVPYLSIASRAASLAPPTLLWTLPSALSALPSACILVSPVTLPAASFTAPLACLAAPAIRSLSMALPLVSAHRDMRRLRGGERDVRA